MTLQTFIFIGRSGCGKGTQVKLLDEVIQNKDPQTPIYHMETGRRFCDFIAQEGYTNMLSRKVMESGARQPDFLAIWMWTHHFVEDLKGTEHLLIDGTPRSLNEAHILDNALHFFSRTTPHVVYLNVSRQWSEDRLHARGRADDLKDGIKQRLDWYEKDVVPAVEYYKNNPDYHFIDVNGEQSIEAVHADILQNIKFV